MLRQRVPATAVKNEVSTEKKCYRCKVHKPAGELGVVKKSCGFRRCAAENPRIFLMAKRQSPLDAGLCPFPLPHFFSVHLRVSYQTRKK